MNYFANCTDQDQAKARYRELAKVHHPDIQGGNLATMQEITRQFKAFQITQFVDAQGPEIKDTNVYEKTVAAFTKKLKEEICRTMKIDNETYDLFFNEASNMGLKWISEKVGFKITQSTVNKVYDILKKFL